MILKKEDPWKACVASVKSVEAILAKDWPIHPQDAERRNNMRMILLAELKSRMQKEAATCPAWKDLDFWAEHVLDLF